MEETDTVTAPVDGVNTNSKAALTLMSNTINVSNNAESNNTPHHYDGTPPHDQNHFYTSSNLHNDNIINNKVNRAITNDDDQPVEIVNDFDTSGHSIL